MIELNEELRRALRDANGSTLRLTDPETQQDYVLVRADLYERVKSLIEDNYDLKDTYPAQMESAMRAGWADPVMDEYDNYGGWVTARPFVQQGPEPPTNWAGLPRAR